MFNGLYAQAYLDRFERQNQNIDLISDDRYDIDVINHDQRETYIEVIDRKTGQATYISAPSDEIDLDFNSDLGEMFD